MIFVTGDCHSEFHKFNTASFPEQFEMNREDYVIICGDFGGIWDWKRESKYERFWMNWIEEKTYTTLFVDGNHENFERLSEYPTQEWNGGKVHVIRPHVLHLMRGEVFNINEKKFFAFGGARSHDINGGIFEPDDPTLKRKVKLAEDFGQPYRINHRTWWKEEMPDAREMGLARQNLEKHGNQVDFIITHDCPASVRAIYSQGTYKPDELSRFLEEIKQNVQYRYWFFGHYHADRQVTEKDFLLYDQIIRIQ